MFSIFLCMFVFCLLVNIMRSGEGYNLFYRYVTFMNSLSDTSPRFARTKPHVMFVDYKVGKKTYGVLIPAVIPAEHLKWIGVAVVKDIVEESEPAVLDRTLKINYYAGVFKNFHGIPVTPKMISRSYKQMFFEYGGGVILTVERDQPIIATLEAARHPK